MTTFRRRIHEGEVEVGQPFNPHRVFVGSVVPNVIMRYKGLTSTEKLCLARLYQYAGNDGACYPSQSTLAEELGASNRQRKRIIKKLRDRGFIEISRPADRMSPIS